MKICRLAPIAIACLAVLMPRLGFSEGAVGGAVKQAKPDCDSEMITYNCNTTDPDRQCRNLLTTQPTTNPAVMHYIRGNTVQNCATVNKNACHGRASSTTSECIPPL
jgi:hypothetical protein